jgi:hypothetical protein
MKEQVKRILNVALGLLLCAALAWYVYFLARAAFIGLSTIKSDVSVAIIAAVSGATLSVISLIVTKHLESRTAILQELRVKKIPVYEHLIRIVFSILFAEKLGKTPPSQEKLMKQFADFTEKLLVWGSDDVIRAYSRFRTAASGSPVDIAAAQEDLFLAIRKDLGHKSKNMPRGMILGLFINDIEEFLHPKAKAG